MTLKSFTQNMPKRHKLSTSISAALMVLATALSAPTWAANDALNIKVKEGYLLGADNNQIFYRELGKEKGKNKDTIIYLHGGPGFDLNDGGYELDPLAEKYRVIVYDQRGGGYSEAIEDPANMSAAHHVEDIEALVEHFNIDKFTLMGQSWGAGLGMMYADKYPQRLNRLILLSPMPIREAMWNYRFTQTGKLLTPEQNQQFIDAATQDLSNATDAEIIANCQIYIPLVFLPYLSPVSDWNNMKGDYCGSDPQGMTRRWANNAATMSSIVGFDWREIATNYHGPTYILDGQWSMVPLNTTREWGAYLPNAKVEIVENSGHLVWLDNPTKLFDSVETFMQGQWPDNAKTLDLTELDLLARYSFEQDIKNDMDNRFDAQVVGNVEFSSDRFGNDSAAYFATSNDQLVVTTPSWAAEPKNWSWTGWINLKNQPFATRTLITQGDAVKLELSSAKLRFSVGGLQVEDANAISANQWVHIGVVQNGDSIQLYRNAELVAQGTASDLPQLQGDFSMQNPIGKLDDIRVYSGSLDQSQMVEIYQKN